MAREKRYVTREMFRGTSWFWGIWDKVTCDWYDGGYFTRTSALKVADKLNRQS